MCNKYCRRLGVYGWQHGSLEALLRGFRIRLVDHTSFFDLARGFLRQDMDCDLDSYLRSVFAVVHDHMASFRFATFNVVKTHSALLCQDIPSIFMHLYGRLAALTSSLWSRRLPI